MEASQVPVTDLYCDEDEHHVVNMLMRSNATAGKRPRSFVPVSPPSSSSQDEEQAMWAASMDQPDLHSYFDQWEMEDKHKILLCRSYASYLSAKGHSGRK